MRDRAATLGDSLADGLDSIGEESERSAVCAHRPAIIPDRLTDRLDSASEESDRRADCMGCGAVIGARRAGRVDPGAVHLDQRGDLIAPLADLMTQASDSRPGVPSSTVSELKGSFVDFLTVGVDES